MLIDPDGHAVTLIVDKAPLAPDADPAGSGDPIAFQTFLGREMHPYELVNTFVTVADRYATELGLKVMIVPLERVELARMLAEQFADPDTAAEKLQSLFRPDGTAPQPRKAGD